MAHPIEDWAASQIARYGAIGAGLLIGTAARYGLTLNEGRKLSRQTFIADFLLLGMLGVISVAITDWMALTGNTKVLVGSLAAVSGDRIVRLIRTAFLKRAAAELEHLSQVAKAGDVIKVPAGAGIPDEVGAHSGTADDPMARAGAALQGSFRQTTITRPPLDQIELLKKLDQPRE